MAEIQSHLTIDERDSRKFVMPVFGQSPTGKPDHYLVPFTQYLLPDGRKRNEDFITKEKDVAEKAQDILNAGFRFDIEILRNGVVSATIGGLKDFRDGGDPEDTDCAMELTVNGPSLVGKIEKMIREFANFEDGVYRG